MKYTYKYDGPPFIDVFVAVDGWCCEDAMRDLDECHFEIDCYGHRDEFGEYKWYYCPYCGHKFQFVAKATR